MKKVFSVVINLIIVSLAFVALPAFAVTDDEIQSRCWTMKQCEQDYNGVWGKSDTYMNTQAYGAGKKDQWSIDNCRDIGADATARCFAKPPDLPLQVGIPGVSDKICSVPDKRGVFTACGQVGQSCNGSGVCKPGIRGGFPGYLAA